MNNLNKRIYELLKIVPILIGGGEIAYQPLQLHDVLRAFSRLAIDGTGCLMTLRCSNKDGDRWTYDDLDCHWDLTKDLDHQSEEVKQSISNLLGEK